MFIQAEEEVDPWLKVRYVDGSDPQEILDGLQVLAKRFITILRNNIKDNGLAVYFARHSLRTLRWLTAEFVEANTIPVRNIVHLSNMGDTLTFEGKWSDYVRIIKE